MQRKLSKQELVELVRRIIAVKGTEEEIDEMISSLEANVPHPRVTDLIFCHKGERAPTPEEIVEEALAYGPIRL